MTPTPRGRMIAWRNGRRVVMTVSQVTLFSSDDYRVDYVPAEGEQTAIAITFSERGHRYLDGLGYGNGFMLRRGCGLIAVKGCRDRWYQDFPDQAVQAMVALLEQPALRGLRRVTYGSSMGAYAALAFSRALVADAVVAISPLADLLLTGEERWREDGVERFRSLDEIGLLPSTRVVVAFDPFDPDARHAAIIDRLAGDRAELVRLPFAGHPVGPSLHGAGCLKDLAMAVLRGEALPDIVGRMRRRRRDYIHHPFILALQCRQRGRPNWAYAMVRLALDRNPFDAEYNIVASTLADRVGTPADAVRYAATAIAMKPEHVSGLSQLADVLVRHARSETSLVWLDQAIALRPELEGLRTQRASIVARLG